MGIKNGHSPWNKNQRSPWKKPIKANCKDTEVGPLNGSNNLSKVVI